MIAGIKENKAHIFKVRNSFALRIIFIFLKVASEEILRLFLYLLIHY